MSQRWQLQISVLGVAFGVLVAGTSAGWLIPQIRLVSVVSMTILVLLWIRALTQRMDAVDAAAIVVLIAFAVSTATSALPWLSTESLFGAGGIAAVFGLARRLAPAARSSLLVALGMLAGVLTLAMLLLWTLAWMRWFQMTGLLPSLSLRLPSAPFGHPHDVALLVGIAAPAAVALAIPGRPRVRAVVVSAFLLAAALLMFVSGSRAVWLAAGVATIVVAMGSRSQRVASWVRAHGPLLALVLGALIVVLVVSGVGRLVVDRMTASVTIDMRLAIWESALKSWSSDPLTGNGPGTFGFLLQPTGYYDSASFAPAHADSMYVQALAELGLVGVMALSLLVIAVAKAWRRNRPMPEAVWAISFFAVAGLAANPSALGYCAFLIALWAGVATPMAEPAEARKTALTRPLLAVAFLGLALPLGSAVWAAIAFDSARARLESDPAGALVAADDAVHLDPDFALYRRDRGSLLIGQGMTADALGELRRAIALNPWDDAGYRALAVAALEEGRAVEALEAAREASRLQATEALNQATLAYVAGTLGEVSTRDMALAALVTLAPWATADPAWSVAYPDVTPTQALSEAADAAVTTTMLREVDARWLFALTAAETSRSAVDYTPTQKAFALIASCRAADARTILLATRNTEGYGWAYWFARVVVGQLTGIPEDAAINPMVMLSPPTRPGGSPLAAPLVDEAGYARRPLGGGVGGPILPSQDEGIRAWIDDPDRALAVIRGAHCA